VRTRNAARSTDLATDFLRLRYHGHAGEQHADGLFGALVISSEEDDEAAGRATLTTASAADGGDEAAADDAMEWVWVLSDMYDAPAATLAAASSDVAAARAASPTASSAAMPGCGVSTIGRARPGPGAPLAPGASSGAASSAA
jgi:hypothetical protein